MSKPDYYGAQRDWTIEQLEELQREIHDSGYCQRAPLCGYCLDEIDEDDEEDKAEGYYDSRGHWVK